MFFCLLNDNSYKFSDKQLDLNCTLFNIFYVGGVRTILLSGHISDEKIVVRFELLVLLFITSISIIFALLINVFDVVFFK